MASHVQAHRRQPERAPGVLHRAAPGSVPKFTRSARTERRAGWSRWRVASGALLVMFGWMLVLFFTSDGFYVAAVQVRGNDFVPSEEIYAFADIANLHVFWLDPAVIRENVLRSPSVADVSVEIGFPPDLVTLNLQERQPAIVWSDAGAETWIDIQGRAMPARREMPNLLHVHLTRAGNAGLAASADDFTADTVVGALRLREILPAGASLDYHAAHGLGWTNEMGWRVWMGSDGAAVMSEKIKIYDVLAEDLAGRGIEVAELNIANPDAPFYRILGGR